MPSYWGGFEAVAPWTGVITNVESGADWRNQRPRRKFDVGAIGLAMDARSE